MQKNELIFDIEKNRFVVIADLGFIIGNRVRVEVRVSRS